MPVLLLLVAPLLAFFGSEAPPPAASATSGLELVGPIRYSDWSRSSYGDTRTELEAAGLLQKVEVGERGDKPCYLKATFLRINGSGTTTRTIDECGSRGPTNRSRVEIGTVSSASAPHGIYSLRACKGESPRVKGLQLERKNLLFSTSGIASTGQEYRQLEFKRTNCQLVSASGWDPTTRTCPATSNGTPTFAVGLGVAINNDSVANLRLMCKEVRRTSAAPARRARLGRN